MLANVAGKRRGRKSLNFCNLCDNLLPPGGAVVDIAVMFADIRGSTTLGEKVGAEAFVIQLSRVYAVATRVLSDKNGLIDKILGDEVMGPFPPNIEGDYILQAIRSAELLIRALRNDPSTNSLTIGIGVHADPAFVGRVGPGDVYDFTALDDTPHPCAKLQNGAASGEVLCSEELC